MTKPSIAKCIYPQKCKFNTPPYRLITFHAHSLSEENGERFKKEQDLDCVFKGRVPPYNIWHIEININNEGHILLKNKFDSKGSPDASYIS